MKSSPCYQMRARIMGLLRVVSWFLLLSIGSSSSALAGMGQPGCQDKCGNVSIPYPFGIGPNHCFLEGLEVTCNTSTGTTYLGAINDNIAVFDFDLLLQGEVRVRNPLTWDCYNSSNLLSNYSIGYTGLAHNYKVSSRKNKFTVIGCDSTAYILGSKNNKSYYYASGCMSFCITEESVEISSQCTAIGCCQSPIPGNLTSLYPSINTRNQTLSNSTLAFNPCSYAFVAEEEWFKFDTYYLGDHYFADKYVDGVPLVLDWVAGNKSCDEAKKNMSYACVSKNSECIPSVNGLGYLCNCSNGYKGNPYLEDGCGVLADIDECALPLQYPCPGNCANTIGSYSCSQVASPGGEQPMKMVLGICISTVILLTCIFALVIECQKRKLLKEKDSFFEQNGGLLLLEEIRSRRVDTMRIFSEEELEKATNNFDKSSEVGRGGYGVVYRGVLKDNRVVAVKRSKVGSISKKDDFVQEIIILSQINHRNVVRLLGCCLEVEVPILVYEFIPKGTLFQLIHTKRSSISLDDRLRIASESSEALSYLHSSASPPIVHGDVKSPNILLDDNYMAKVTDFGTAQMLVKDEEKFMTVVRGTLGYLDPTYLEERQLTEKSDVYSFGVVILELITRKPAIYSEGSTEDKSLASSFLVAMKEKKLQSILDRNIIGVGMELLEEIAKLAEECLSKKGEERPSMTRVAERLKVIRTTWRQQLMEHHADEIEDLPENIGSNYTSTTTHHGGLQTLDIELGR